jgi:asparagine synthase (glutamine-hydrolysing)
MCGIAGFVSARQRDGAAMIRALHHRGPDAQGSFSAEINGRQVFLGHARLSIIDLSAAGTQPMFTADRQIALVFNGEIYNFQALRSRFLSDVQFHSNTDTEVLLALYERMGFGFLEHLNGDFAIAILDQRRGKLLLIRDRIGVKPLYVWQSSEELVFGSEIKALLAGGVEPVLQQDKLQKYFVFKYTPGAETLFRGVQRLPPGHWLEYDLTTYRSRIACWWEPRTETDSSLSYKHACEKVREIVQDATSLRLVADVPVGNFLSGGLDSTIIASQIRDQEKIVHYCARQSEAANAMEGTSSDYSHARRLADQWKLNFQPIDIGAAELTRERISQTQYFADDLIADSAQIPAWLITEGGGKTSRVFLSGMGADEIFLGYVGHLLTLLSSYVDATPGHNMFLEMVSNLDQGRGRFKSIRRYLYRLGKYRNYPAWRPAVFSLVGDFETSASLVDGDLDEIDAYLTGYFPEGQDPFQGFKRFEFDNFLQKNLSYTDRMSMANSVEVRVPFLDHRLVDLAGTLPREYKLGNLGKAKRILKDTFGEGLPAYITHRKKAGFAMPIRSIFGSRGSVEALLDIPLLADAGRVHVPAVRAIVEAHTAGREDNSSLIYALISFQEWYKLFFR